MGLLAEPGRFLIATSRAVARLQSAVEVQHFDPLRVSSQDFLRRFEQLEHAIHAPRGRCTPRWALYDCAALPGVIVGLCAPEPVSLLMAVPTVLEGQWSVVALGALGEQAEARMRATLSFARELLQPSSLVFMAAQGSKALELYEELGQMEILASELPAYDAPASYVLRLGSPGGGETVSSIEGSSSMLQPRNHALLSELEPYAVAAPGSWAYLDCSPFGISIAEDARINPLDRVSAPFFEMLMRLDAATFGPEGMPMPRWLFWDAAALPGAIVGLGQRAEKISSHARALLGVPDTYSGIVPYSMYIAMPTVERSVWVGHNLVSLAAELDEGRYRGLGSVTKALALKVMRVGRQIGVTQWASAALRIHAQLGPLELLSAFTPGHSIDESLTYRVSIDDSALRHLARDPAGTVAYPAPDFWIESDDREAMKGLQERIERGERFCLAGIPVAMGEGRQRAPIARMG